LPVRWGVILFFAWVSFLALKEFLTIVPALTEQRRGCSWVYVVVPLQYYWVAQGSYGMFLLSIPVFVFLLLPLRSLLIGDTKGFLPAIGTLNWGLMTLVFGLSHGAYLAVLSPDRNPRAGGAGLVLFVVFLTQFNDVAQYCWGKLLGAHKIIPLVSPNKTWEGLLGGVLTTVVLAALLSGWLTPMSWPMALLAGVLIGGAGFVGDVTISALKRDLGLKDTGSLLPGHGGILDRIDSLTYTAPLFFHFIHYLYY
jgi:phosphatidate cytidylyltransferase